MGLRVRLKSDYAIANLPQQSKVILQAMKTYGMILADNGSDYYFEATPNQDGTTLDALKAIPGSAFEVVKPGAMTH